MSPSEKYTEVKTYLADLQMRDLQALQESLKTGTPKLQDYLGGVKKHFQKFFAPMQFKGVNISKNPFEFVVGTPDGELDLDDMSSGEKEIVNNIVRFCQLKPQNSIVFFDEPGRSMVYDCRRHGIK